MTDEIVLHREPVEHIPVVAQDGQSPGTWRYDCSRCGWASLSWTTKQYAIDAAREHAIEPRYVDEAGNEWRKVTP